MNRDIVWTTQFKKDYKLALKRHLDIELLDMNGIKEMGLELKRQSKSLIK